MRDERRIQTQQLEDWSMLREEEMTSVENLSMQISLPDTEARPDSGIVEQALEHADLWSGSRDCSVS